MRNIQCQACLTTTIGSKFVFFCERISVLGQECGMVTIRGLQLFLKRCDRFSSSSGCWQYVPPERNRKGEGFGEWLFALL